MIFDTHVAVDWSARSQPSPAKPAADAIWIGVVRGGVAELPTYHRTRAAALEAIAALIWEDRVAGRRILVGFDFPFGWPRGLAAHLTGEARARDLWRWFAGRIEDAPDNANNRYDVAEAVNRALPGVGPYWSKSHRDRWAEIPFTDLRDGHGLPRRRLIEEQVRGAKEVWQLAGAGSVGSQAILGVAALERLAAETGAEVWPFDTGLTVPEGDAVLAEIYPSLFNDAVKTRLGDGDIKDAVQVAVTAERIAQWDREGTLASLLSPTVEQPEVIAREEGWILGVPGAVASTPKLSNDCFALPPGVDWTPVDEALERLRAGLIPIAEVEQVPVAQAGGRVLAVAVVARRSNPPAANAAVDGYAFAAAGLAGPVRLPLAPGRAAAGAPFDGTVPPGHALRILTGAVLPEGADTIVLQEDVAVEDGAVRFEARLKPCANVRPAGEDAEAGAEVLAAPLLLRPQDLALASAVGVDRLAVRKPLRVAVLSTGDEVVEPGSAARPGAIFDANRPMLLDLVRRWGYAPVDLGIARDREGEVRAALQRGAAEADAILTSGGASAGDEDHISALLTAEGSVSTWRIAVKPGRPLALGMWQGTPVFGLPGNPVAAFVCTLIFARPALGLMAGAGWQVPQPLWLPAAFEKRKKPGRREYLRARVRDGQVEVFASEGSGRVSGLSWAEGLCELPDDGLDVKPGTPVRYLPFEAFGL
ncbi:gephyrin-like molybdotransferase Glp [Pontivivens ytuae]|uniref:Molybdopterin molybdenumtransferase n=1 Tax=Pontivivens ytuae TaxID=2789856 RepID=A0A7S9LPP8_9RHOB|nr:gephyrin-like molybdotransferase Glp [Pontivivens ytuae]QPH52826.1 molybdopterin molybdenumtransferase MoeA [Pontivivens ytuae]